MSIKVNCKVCNKEETVSPSREKNYKTCSYECSSKLRKAKPNLKCSICSKEFYRKPSHRKKVKNKGKHFCSRKCLHKHYKTAYSGKNNPNYRAKYRDSDGYKLDYIPTIGRVKLHHYITFETLKINKLPKGYCVHHRDCDIDNNNPENLALVTLSDHRWLHKQFGNATLWAYCNNKVTKKELIEWSNNKKKTEKLIDKNLLNQITEFVN